MTHHPRWARNAALAAGDREWPWKPRGSREALSRRTARENAAGLQTSGEATPDKTFPISALSQKTPAGSEFGYVQCTVNWYPIGAVIFHCAL
ncbi:MAG: hypothetical protein WC455_10630 [Dehalococcoidia bacterium]